MTWRGFYGYRSLGPTPRESQSVGLGGSPEFVFKLEMLLQEVQRPQRENPGLTEVDSAGREARGGNHSPRPGEEAKEGLLLVAL